MTDVFISYAAEDRDTAAALAHALAGRGWSVWWDRKLLAGQAFDRTIEQQLETAKCVVVLWSSHSVGSEWVRSEAAFARERGVLVPARIEPVRQPLEFRRTHHADLIAWNGDTQHGGFQALCEAIAAASGRAASGLSAGRAPHAPAMPRRRRAWLVGALAAIALAGGVAFYSWREKAPSAPAAGTGPADLVAGTYFGEVIVDSKGSARSHVTLTVSKLDTWTVLVSADYERLGKHKITLSQYGDKVLNSGGNAVFFLHLDQQPIKLEYNPDGGVVYVGRKK